MKSKLLNFNASVLIFLLTQVADHWCLTYSDLERMGVSCSPRDTCSSPIERTLLSTNCECDSQCHVYNDCCIDAPRRSAAMRVRRQDMTCMPLVSSYEGVYVIAACPGTWEGSAEIQQKCANSEDISDPLQASPTTDVENRITYRNRYCAECNNADLDQLQPWTISVTCDSLVEPNSTYHNISEEYVANHLTYQSTPPNENVWGVYHWNNESSEEEFYPCLLEFHLPEYLKDHVRFCRPNIISTCAKNWRRNSVRRQCQSYLAVVYFNSLSFRNPHCALCNNLELDRQSCMIGLLTKKPPLSFALLLDVNRSDGNMVGLSDSGRKCSDGKKWDMFFKVCRTIVCALRGHVLVNGRCVRE